MYNVLPKGYSFSPTPTGAVLLKTRSSTRARLYAGGSYFRSKERGEVQNQLKLSVIQDDTGEGLFVIQNKFIKPKEVIFGVNMTAPEIQLLSLDLKFDEELRLEVKDGDIHASIRGIRWQIAGSTPANSNVLRKDLGVVTANKLFSAPGIVVFKEPLSADQFPANGYIVFRPVVHQYHLVQLSSTDATTLIAATGWDISALRAAVNADDTLIRMPVRGSSDTTAVQPAMNEDTQDVGMDDLVLSNFDEMFMTGGDGLPLSPAGLNTGPERALLHLNYAEKDDGTLGASQGSWELY
jgi:hypothetical protein